MHSTADIKKRMDAAKKYRPKDVRLLLLAEAPPCDTSRYFYFEGIPNHDWLYVYVCRGLFGEVEIADLRARKAEYLKALCENGVFMIDLAPDGMSSPTLAQLKPLIAGAVERCGSLNPDSVVLIKSSVYDVAFETLKAAEVRAIDVRMPFPASGQQPAFLRLFASALKLAKFRVPLARPA